MSTTESATERTSLLDDPKNRSMILFILGASTPVLTDPRLNAKWSLLNINVPQSGIMDQICFPGHGFVEQYHLRTEPHDYETGVQAGRSREGDLIALASVIRRVQYAFSNNE
jgi:hypothetical protein